MDNQNPAIRLYNLIKSKTNEQTAHDTVNILQGTIKGEVKNEISSSTGAMDVKFGALEVKLGELEVRLGNRINNVEIKLGNFKVEMIDRISDSKFQTILWIVGVGILQVVARYLFK